LENFRVVFSERQNTKKPDEVVMKKFIYSTQTFEFGPLRTGLPCKRYEAFSISIIFFAVG